ncbi:ABC transporter permease subunit [Dactylosporangium sp. NPDC000244]|uniref:ABC transporter permease subunit n=1 Tax=Dactylosporangium sp. NPDC000244 TaxID=3154365 RepID=UPI0033220EBA
MRHLFAAEWSRLFARRISLVTAVLVGTLLAFLTFGFTLTGSSPSAAEQAAAAERAGPLAQLWDQRTEHCGRVQSGLEQAEPGEDLPKACDYGPRPTADSLLDYGFSFHRQWPSLYYGAAVLFALAGFVLGASFVGVEWSSGGMAGLLLWAPRRGAVLGAKLLAVVSGVALMSVVYLGLWTAAFLALAPGNDNVSRMSAPEFGSLLLTGLRVVFIAMAGTALGFSVASIGRHTSAALGAGIAYLLLWEFGSTVVFTVVETIDYAEPYRLSSYARAWLNLGVVPDPNTTANVARSTFHATWGTGGLVIAAVVAAVAAAAFLSMRRRDAR